MKRLFEGHRLAALLLNLALAIAAASLIPALAAPKLKVVAATSDLAALAAEVGGDRIEIESLARGYQEPHPVEAKPSFLLKLRTADLLISVGLRLESGWLTQRFRMPSWISQSGNPRIQVGASGYFDASQYAEILEIPSGVTTPAVGVHPFGNPHYLLDPENGRKVAQAIANKLSDMRPNDAFYFNERFQTFSKQLTDAEEMWNGEMRPYHGRKVVTYHRSWPNFLKHFQLISAGEIEPHPGNPPSRSHTGELINLMKHENVRIVLVEPYYELKTPNAIARETGAQVVVMPPSVGGEKEVTDYFKLFDYDLALLGRAFKTTQ